MDIGTVTKNGGLAEVLDEKGHVLTVVSITVGFEVR
jgi:hypothetical protein